MIVETKGKWQPFEAVTGQELEIGKTYKIEIEGICEFAVSKDRPDTGLQTNKLNYTKTNDTQLWIKTGN